MAKSEFELSSAYSKKWCGFYPHESSCRQDRQTFINHRLKNIVDVTTQNIYILYKIRRRRGQQSLDHQEKPDSLGFRINSKIYLWIHNTVVTCRNSRNCIKSWMVNGVWSGRDKKILVSTEARVNLECWEKEASWPMSRTVDQLYSAYQLRCLKMVSWSTTLRTVVSLCTKSEGRILRFCLVMSAMDMGWEPGSTSTTYLPS